MDKELFEKRFALLKSSRPFSGDFTRQIQDDLFLKYNQASNAIEGNSLTLNETKVILEYGITVKGKSLRDHLDVINHQHAIDYLEELVANHEPLSERVIKDLHTVLMKTEPSHTPGAYRKVPVMIQGATYVPPDPIYVGEQMQALVNHYYEIKMSDIDPLERIAQLHSDFIGIHPFSDGNGRTGRLIMNLELMKEGYPIAIIQPEDRYEYYDALELAQTQKNYSQITKVIRDAVGSTMEWLISLHEKFKAYEQPEPDIER